MPVKKQLKERTKTLYEIRLENENRVLSKKYTSLSDGYNRLIKMYNVLNEQYVEINDLFAKLAQILRKKQLSTPKNTRH